MATIFDQMKNMFNKKTTLKDIGVDDLRKERLYLDRNEAELLKKVRDIEKQKREVFAAGTDVASDRERKIAAQKYKELDRQAANYDRSLAVISQQIRAVNGFIQIKEQHAYLAKTPLGDILFSMDTESLKETVLEASVGQDLNMQKLGMMVGAVEGADSMLGNVVADPEETAILDAMRRASEAKDDPAALERGIVDADEALRRKTESDTAV